MKFITAKELFQSKPKPVEWVCEPWLARESITELDGAPKSAGKTTFALAMCRAILKGESFLGYATAKGRIVYLTEESETTFRSLLREQKFRSLQTSTFCFGNRHMESATGDLRKQPGRRLWMRRRGMRKRLERQCW